MFPLTIPAPANEITNKRKRTCENCSKAKVKCTGSLPNQPCNRCQMRSLECIFVNEKKRGRRSSNASQKKLCGQINCWGDVTLTNKQKAKQTDWLDKAHTLQPYLKRLLLNFFVVYKSHSSNSSCCREWFAYQLNKMCLVLIQQKSPHTMTRLAEWMNHQKIKVMPREEGFYRSVPGPTMENGMQLPPVLTTKGPKFANIEVEASSNDKKSGFVKREQTTQFTVTEEKLLTGIQQTAFMKVRATNEHTEISVNGQFTAFFGYTGEELTKIINQIYGGFLPWGGDILGVMLVKDSDLLAILRILAIKFSQLGNPTKFPCDRKVTSCHDVQVYTKLGYVSDCHVRCLHVEHLTLSKICVEIYLGFEASGPLQSCNNPSNPLYPNFVDEQYEEKSQNVVANLEAIKLEHNLESMPVGSPDAIEDVLNIPQDLNLGFDFSSITENTDDQWFGGILDWADENSSGQDLTSSFPDSLV